jgi:hypothetical protein
VVCLCVHFSADFEILSALQTPRAEGAQNQQKITKYAHTTQNQQQYQMRRVVRSIIVASKRTTLLVKRTHGVVTSIGHAPFVKLW